MASRKRKRRCAICGEDPRPGKLTCMTVLFDSKKEYHQRICVGCSAFMRVLLRTHGKKA